jgi:oxygen-independent coproporphyrinogen-3 oxidase
MVNYSVYIHIPFCQRRCGYCDFNTYAGIEDLIPDYVKAIGKEIELLTSSSGERMPIHTIYFGGGTPSLLSGSQLETILHTIEKCFTLGDNLEITLEANPGTVSMEYLSNVHSLGINRLSLGMQSAVVRDLNMLGRQHHPLEVYQAVRWAHAAGFDQINLDLIYGIPSQTLDHWIETLLSANSLEIDHLSLYCLSVETHTPLDRWIRRGLVSEPDPDLSADMYEWADNFLDREGYQHYEISNWARKDLNGTPLTCKHNLQYWRNMPYIGIGSGAHGYVHNFRTVNIPHPNLYIQRCLEGKPENFPRTPATFEMTAIDKKTEISEALMMGLRLIQEGVSAKGFHQRFGENLVDRFEQEIGYLIHNGLLEWAGENEDILRLTPRGHLLGNQVFMAFL